MTSSNMNFNYYINYLNEEYGSRVSKPEKKKIILKKWNLPPKPEVKN
jgi:hypothetical protein